MVNFRTRDEFIVDSGIGKHFEWVEWSQKSQLTFSLKACILTELKEFVPFLPLHCKDSILGHLKGIKVNIPKYCLIVYLHLNKQLMQMLQILQQGSVILLIQCPCDGCNCISYERNPYLSQDRASKLLDTIMESLNTFDDDLEYMDLIKYYYKYYKQWDVNKIFLL